MSSTNTTTTVIKLKLIDSSTEFLAPKLSKPGDAGFDIISAENIKLSAGRVAVVPTPFVLADAPDFLPDGSDYYIKVNSRSGMAAKFGVFPISGTIDKGYRGQIKLVLMNGGHEDVQVCAGDRIAQMVVHKIEANNLTFELTDTVNESTRGSNGFGSTGQK